jgi:hypothetical protein
MVLDDPVHECRGPAKRNVEADPVSTLDPAADLEIRCSTRRQRLDPG